MPRLQPATAIAAGMIGLLAPGLASAHFILTTPTNWMTQVPGPGGGSPQKTGPCGNEVVAGQMPTGIISPVRAGQQVSVTVDATVAHPGWWRVALVEGRSSSQTLTSLPDPVPQAGTNCTPAIMANPVWSPTQHILADGLGLPANAPAMGVQQSGTPTFQVTIPQNATCTDASPCSLQVIMVMTDHPVNNCYYHHCADISFQTGNADGGATGTGGATGAGGSGTGSGGSATSGGGGQAGMGGSAAMGSAGNSGTGGGAAGSGSGGSSGGGCSIATGKMEWATGALTLLALAAFTRRRARK
jgi:hypothetical protein